jgi:hypothetical protein
MADKKTYPKGYQFMNPFVDVDGIVYRKGKGFCPEENGTLPTTIMFNKLFPDRQIYPPVPKKVLGEISEAPAEGTPVIKETPQLDELNAKINRLESMMAEMATGRQSQQIIVREESKQEFGKGIRNITPDDFDKKGKRYFKYGQGGPVSSYIGKNGNVVIAPFNVTCEFKYHSSDMRKIDGQIIPVPFCMYETHSKKEMAFIEGHPEYGILISESWNRVVQTTTSSEITRLETALTRVQQMKPEELFLAASVAGMPEGLDINEIKSRLAWKTAKEEMEGEHSMQMQRMGDMSKEKAMFETK